MKINDRGLSYPLQVFLATLLLTLALSLAPPAVADHPEPPGASALPEAVGQAEALTHEVAALAAHLRSAPAADRAWLPERPLLRAKQT